MNTNTIPHIDFLVPGFSKCGTTTLCAMLEQHPDIFISENKEPNLFACPDYLNELKRYRSYFTRAPEEVLKGEGTTYYSNYEFEKISRERILEHFPDIKLIFIARDPFKRIESSYREFHHSGPYYGLDAPFGIRSALEQFPEMLEDSTYWKRLSNYRDYMADENILIVFQEELKLDPGVVLRSCFEFLGVDPARSDTIRIPQLNRGESKLYDSKLLRKLRNHPRTGFKIARIPVDTQNRMFPLVGLRRRFREKISWDDNLRAYIRSMLQEDSRRFLQYTGRPESIWPDMFS